MATLAGYNVDDSSNLSLGNALLPAGEQARTRSLVPPQGGPVPTYAIPQDLLGARHTWQRHLGVLGYGFPGWVGEAYSDDFYHRVHFIPKSIDLGVFASNTGVEYLVWNAFFEKKSFSSLLGVDVDGLSITGPLPTFDYGAISVYTYDLVAQSDVGPATIDGEYQYTIGGVTYTLPVSGIRVIFFPFLPNWRTPVGEKLGWNNSRIRSESGKRQAASYTENPAQVYDWEVLLVDKDHELFENMVWLSQWRNYLIPIPTDVGWTLLGSAVSVDDTVLSVSNDDGIAFQDGGFVAIYLGTESYEVAQIETYLPGSITLARGLKSNWPAGADIFPVAPAHMNKKLSTQAVTDEVATLRLNWTCDAATHTPHLTDEAAPITYNGYELYVAPPNRKRPAQVNYLADYDSVSSPGSIFYDQNQDHSDISRIYDWLLGSRQEITDFKAFLKRRDGARVPCYIPLWQKAFELLDPVFSASSVLVLVDNAFLKFVGVHSARNHVVIYANDGTFYPNEITGFTDNNDGTVDMQLANVHGVDLDPSEVEGIYLLPLMEMNSLVGLTWHTNGVLQTSVGFTTANP